MNEKTAKELLTKVIEDYNLIIEDFDRTRKTDWQEFHTFLEHINDNQSVIDLGCGNGRFYSFLKKYRKVQYLGMDNNKNLLEKAKTQFGETFIEGDMLDIPVEKDKYDVVVSIASLHHIPSKKLQQKAIREILRILKKNGIAIITVWNLFQTKYKKYIWQARLRHLLSLGNYSYRDTFIPWGNSEVKRYYYAFNPQELENLLLENDFKIIAQQKGKNLVYICQKY